MNIQTAPQQYFTNKKALLILSIFAGVFVLLAMAQDLLEADFKQSSFYISESFLFSSFWWLFVPFLYLQFKFSRLNKLTYFKRTLLAAVPIFLHLFAFPALVWIISRLFFYHTFRFAQTLQYELSSQLIKLILLYTIPVFIFRYFKSKIQQKEKSVDVETKVVNESYQSSFIVADGSRRMSILVEDIFYFTANSPYINIHHKTKKFLHSETLKSIAEKIDPNLFIRIHKSTIVNMQQVQSYVSRLNGDYDLTMKDGTELRISRNYAAAFKARFQPGHHLTTG